MTTAGGLSGGTLVIVNYNQALEIEPFLEQVKKVFPNDRTVVVDDGSTDGSREIAERMGFRVLAHSTNRGVGASIRTGLRHAQTEGSEWVLITASNGKMLPAEFARVYGPIIRGEADYVQGNRYLESGGSPGLTPFRRLMIPAFSFFASLLIGRRFGDITCGLRAYRLAIVNDPEIDINQAWLDRYELEYYVHFWAVRSRRKYRIVEVPVTMRYSQLAADRKSKIQPITGWWSMVRPFLFLALRLRK